MRPPVEKQFLFDAQRKYRVAAGDVKLTRNPGFVVSANFSLSCYLESRLCRVAALVSEANLDAFVVATVAENPHVIHAYTAGTQAGMAGQSDRHGGIGMSHFGRSFAAGHASLGRQADR
jgi:hypothetical protein